MVVMVMVMVMAMVMVMVGQKCEHGDVGLGFQLQVGGRSLLVREKRQRLEGSHQ